MKINCPDCRQVIPAENVDLRAGWAKCNRCNEVFKLAEVLDGYVPQQADAEPLPQRPFDAWAVTERTAESLIVHVAPQGMRGGTWALLGFALVWLGFIAFWTAGALGVFFGNGMRLENALFAAFSTPFWLIGLGMLVGVLWSARGHRVVYVDASIMKTEIRCLAWRRRKAIDRSEVQHAREGAFNVRSRNGQPAYSPYAVEIIYTKGSFRLPCNSQAEREWLIAEINDFLKAVPYRPGPYVESPHDADWARSDWGRRTGA